MPSRAPMARMRWLRARLWSIRNGTGAVILPPTVTRLALNFNKANANGHMGAKKFWQECLPRLKYHNPDIEMTVTRKEATTGPAILSVHFSDKPEPVPIDMQNKFTVDIMDELIAQTQAKKYTEPPRSAELEEESAYLSNRREVESAKKLAFNKSRKASYMEKVKRASVPQPDILA